MSRFGEFLTEPEIAFAPRSDDMVLKAPLVYVSPEGERDELPTGFRWDGASWMAWLLSILGMKVHWRMRRPTAFHDRDCRERTRSAWRSHRAFWRTMRLEGVHPAKAAYCWFFVTLRRPWWTVRPPA